MTSSAKSGKNKAIDLETDLLLSQKDIAFMKKNHFQNDRDLEAYLDFLEAIDAFESRKVKTKFYEAEFEL
ncbi:MAG: hypothetical protein BA868_08885 [Desulfobacterales bacterium C00003106]|jgi:hypothetical protein|nr:MAG: hypothetical protein BA868_08885 [Desulfobacterales bacterium C00003106]